MELIQHIILLNKSVKHIETTGDKLFMAVKFKDYYQILGVSKTASQGDIKKAYRKLARKYHPDVSKAPDAEEKFKEITEANEVLGNEENRKKYDRLGTNWKAGQEFTPPPDSNNVHFEFHGPDGAKSVFEEFGSPSEFFETLFGQKFGGPRQHASSRPIHGQDHEAEVTISLQDAFYGTKKFLSLQTAELDKNGQIQRNTKTYNVSIPAGTTNGSRIRLKGQGGAGINNGPPGDLYLRVTIAPDSKFRLNGSNLEFDLHLAPWEAALGAKISVPTMNGPASLLVPPGIQNGQKLRLQGKGLPSQSATKAGDLLARVYIQIPKKLSEKEKELFQTLQSHSKFRPREDG